MSEGLDPALQLVFALFGTLQSEFGAAGDHLHLMTEIPLECLHKIQGARHAVD